MASRRRPSMGDRIDGAAPDATITPIVRGRDAFTEKAAPAAGDASEIPTALIDPSPDNPRGSVGDVTELAASIEALGVISPLLVTANGDRYDLVFGHRRLAAANLAGLATVPAVVSTDVDPKRVRAKRVVENVQREDLTPLEEARAYQELLDLKVEGGQKGLAKLVGKSPAHISKRLSLLRLPVAVQDKIDAGEVTLSDAVELTKLADHPDRVTKAVEAAAGGTWGGVPATVKRELRDAEDEQAREVEAASLRALGVSVLDEALPTNRTDGPYPLLHFGGDTIDPEAHAKLPCHAAMPGHGRTMILVCLDPQVHLGKRDAERDEFVAAQRAERERQEAAEKAASLARRAFVENLVRKGSPDAGAALLVGQIIGGRHYYLRVDDANLAELLGLSPDTFTGKGPTGAIETYVAKGTRNSLRAVYATGVLLGEAAIAGYDSSGGGRVYFEHLVAAGYQLSEVEAASLAEWVEDEHQMNAEDEGEGDDGEA